MAYRFNLPDLGEGIVEAEIVHWHVAPGDRVAEGDPLLQVETEKAIVEIPSPATGRIASLAAAEGIRVPVGALLVQIETVGEAAPHSDSSDGDAEREPVTDTPVRAGGHSRIPSRIERPGPHGARGRLIRRLSRTQQEVPAVTVVDQCDFTALDTMLADDARTAFVLKAVAAALRDVPELNASFERGGITQHERHDIGLAIQAAPVLVVPVIKDVGGRSLSAVAEEVRRVTAGARKNTLAPAELRGSTFTVTDGGRFGGLFATPLLNAPEVGVLGLHRVDERPVVRDGEVTIGRVGHVSCTFDHRAADGFHAGILLRRFIELAEEPQALVAADEAAAEGARANTGPTLREQLATVAEPERAGIALDLVRRHAGAIRNGGGEIVPEASFTDLGFDSRMAVELRNRLVAATELSLPATLAFDFPTPSELADHLLEEIAAQDA